MGRWVFGDQRKGRRGRVEAVVMTVRVEVLDERAIRPKRTRPRGVTKRRRVRVLSMADGRWKRRERKVGGLGGSSH